MGGIINRYFSGECNSSRLSCKTIRNVYRNIGNGLVGHVNVCDTYNCCYANGFRPEFVGWSTQIRSDPVVALYQDLHKKRSSCTWNNSCTPQINFVNLYHIPGDAFFFFSFALHFYIAVQWPLENLSTSKYGEGQSLGSWNFQWDRSQVIAYAFVLTANEPNNAETVMWVDM
jgi:hypothetical protein